METGHNFEVKKTMDCSTHLIQTETIMSQDDSIELLWTERLKVAEVPENWQAFNLEMTEIHACTIEKRNGYFHRNLPPQNYTNHTCPQHDVRIIWPDHRQF